MFDDRRYLGGFAVLSLVLLRLVIGWHFLGEGLQKLEYDRHDGEVSLVFSAEGFLKQAKGPLADWYHSQVPDGHGWQQTLAAPRENKVLTADVRNEQLKWISDYKRRRDEAIKKGEQAPTEFDPASAYHAWATQIAADWRAVCEDFKSIDGLSDEQKKKADQALESRLQQLAGYLAAENEAIFEYRHELWRVQIWRDSPEAGEVPFVDERIATNDAEAAGKAAAWVREVGVIESQFNDDLRAIVSQEQDDQSVSSSIVEGAISDPRADRLRTINVVVTVLTISVGVCLLLGLFTRLAAIVAALFLFGVIASQPAWLASAAPTMPQVVEFVGLLVLAGTGAGRWMGLDFFAYALFHRRRDDTLE
jgi:uncharacterized membrane protein YphA (DoxX/SURF4 family)